MNNHPVTPWDIPGYNGAPILGDTHSPRAGDGAPHPTRGHVLIVHGFLGYKDYGMFPMIADTLAEAGFTPLRFNLSHSGVTRRFESFELPERFALDTWRAQAFDINAVADAASAGELPGTHPGAPLVLLGHSRGGVSCLLAAADRFREDRKPLPAAVVTLAAPAACCSLPEDARHQMLEQGHGIVRSNRTGQDLRIDARWLQEQLDDPVWHDVPTAAGTIACPVLAIHGDADPTVPPDSAAAIADAAQIGRACLIQGGDHIFNTPNPFPNEQAPGPILAAALDEIRTFLTTHTPTPL